MSVKCLVPIHPEHIEIVYWISENFAEGYPIQVLPMAELGQRIIRL